MSQREIPQFPLEEYPVNKADGKIKLIEAETTWYWDDNYWQAVVTTEDTFGKGPRRTIKLFRWRWKRRDGVYRWMRDNIFTITNRKGWEIVKAAVERQFGNL